jgi:hypothetical protein
MYSMSRRKISVIVTMSIDNQVKVYRPKRFERLSFPSRQDRDRRLQLGSEWDSSTSI